MSQRGAPVESIVSDLSDRIGDNIRGIRFSGGIGMEQRTVLGEEDSLYRLIRGIILIHLNLRQRVAGVESPACDGGDPIANDSISQRVAVVESPVFDSGNRIGDDNLRQRVAEDESPVSDSGDRIGDDNLRQRVAGVESIFTDRGDGIGCSLYSNRRGNRHGPCEAC